MSSLKGGRRIAIGPSDHDGWMVLAEEQKEDIGTGMQALYALIDNPPPPTFGPSQYVRDDDVFEGLRTFTNPPKVVTTLYAYQIVSSLHITGRSCSDCSAP